MGSSYNMVYFQSVVMTEYTFF